MTAPAEERAAERDAGEPWRVRDVMSAPAVVVGVADPVHAVLGVMHRTGVRHLVVLGDGDRCAGVVDDRRLLLEWALGPQGGVPRTAGELLPHQGRCVVPDAPVSEAARLLIEDSRGAVPVVAADGRVVGIVTARDLLRCLLDEPPEG